MEAPLKQRLIGASILVLVGVIGFPLFLALALRAVPAAPGIIASSAQNILVLDYGT